jgi:uncharacterized membrane protein YfcA
VTPLDLVIAGGAGFLAGGVNALAGGGTLLSFPALIAIGLPAVSANVTNTVALSPGYLGGVLSQRRATADQSKRIRRLGIASGIGGLVGSVLLLLTSDSAFRLLIPGLLFAATLLLASQDWVRAALRLGERATDPVPVAGGTEADGGNPVTASKAPPDPRWLVIPVFAVSVYGGYFGAGLGIMLLAVLGIALHDTLGRLNAIKQVLALVINGTAAVIFLGSHKVYWIVALVMAITSLLGGAAGGRLAGSVKPAQLRAIVVIIGTSVSVAYAVRTWF